MGVASVNAPRHAATVLLLREYEHEVQVLMTLRHASLKFMGGMWVFPGGVLNDDDGSEAALAALPAGSHSPSCERLETTEGVPLDRRECLALTIAACRETFEETGVLLVRNADGSACAPEVIARLQGERSTVATQPAAFAAMLEREALRLDVERLIYWAHWITPSSAPRRFDTRFFAIAAPETQVATADLSEASELTWMSPAKLLANARSGAMSIARPTIYNLEDLYASVVAHPSLDALFTSEGNRTVIPILPKMFREGEQTTLVMPWDAGYEAAPGEGTRSGMIYPESLRRMPSRTRMA